jgi:hypothetical protein
MNNKRHPIKQITRDIWKLSDDGLGAPAIAKLVGTTPDIVRGAIGRGRASGNCLPKVRTKVTSRNSSTLTYGYVGQIIDALSVEQLDWLFKESEAVGYNTCAEYIAELVQDAYFEEQHKMETTNEQR